MRRRFVLLVHLVGWMGLVAPALGAEWYAAPSGKPEGAGTKASPWDLESALGGKQRLGPGDTLWLARGTYRHPDRRLGSPGYTVRLAGAEGRPIHVRAMPGQRATLDGGLTVVAPSDWLWIWDLEILVSENFTMSRTVSQPGSHPADYARPWGGLNVHAGKGCKYIHLLIHDNAQGVSFWSGATDSELYGCIVYDNGWKAPDRGHGHAVYTQNQNGLKTIADCIMTGGYGYTMHAYGSSRAYVDNYLVTGNLCYDAGTFLIGGGRPSRNIRVLGNLLYKVNMQIGYSAPSNEDCEIRDNVIVDGGLQVNKYKKVVNEGNLILGKADPRPKDADARVELRPSRYDPRRANLAIFNWAKRPTVLVPLGTFAKSGDGYRLMNPRERFGQSVAEGTYDGKAIRVPVEGEFAAMVVVKATGSGP